MNDDLKEVTEETFFKIVFSDPDEYNKWCDWCKQCNGEYIYDKEASKQVGKMPEIDAFKDEICWCDIMTFYLLHEAGYEYHSSLSPYKGEVYVKK